VLTSPVWPFGQHAAIGYLRDLLARPGLPYRARWARHARRRLAPGEINAMAVARFLTEEREVWQDGATARQVKDTVHRALTADEARQLLTPETLSRFVAGFDLSEEQENRLRALLAGDDPDRARPITGALAARAAGTSARPCETVSSHELHYLGPTGLPARHVTHRVIRSAVDDLRGYQYQIDTEHARVALRRGGRVGNSFPVDGGYLYAFEAVLSRPLAKGETASLEYETVFDYPADDPPPPEFRRAAVTRTENLEMYLRFDRARLPHRVWWAEWDDYRDEARILTQERMSLDTELSVHRFLPYIERTCVGFYWEW
jgi:hypothetical protein